MCQPQSVLGVSVETIVTNPSEPQYKQSDIKQTFFTQAKNIPTNELQKNSIPTKNPLRRIPAKAVDSFTGSSSLIPWDVRKFSQKTFYDLVKTTPQEAAIHQAVNSIPVQSKLRVQPNLSSIFLPFVDISRSLPLQIQRLVEQGNAKRQSIPSKNTPTQ